VAPAEVEKVINAVATSEEWSVEHRDQELQEQREPVRSPLEWAGEIL